ncbi:hypothetical protein OrNV_gp066 [Oryctes rhinoceros nudivirus]|uniref:Uncharacterized protein n=1 Tax=Oryctes rhinoceros nudivirus TaxID=92521 RepID=B7SV87_9VIRU|nr:hypothetical protein OrNV_gp066 [Oryctes rhinoceros nudivirus]ACH96196.1 unknown [Oryctes rhinoceros nudivirus]
MRMFWHVQFGVFVRTIQNTHTNTHINTYVRTYVLDTFDTLYMKCGMLLNTLYVLCGVCRIYAAHVHVCVRVYVCMQFMIPFRRMCFFPTRRIFLCQQI